MKLTTKKLKQIIKEELMAVYEGLGDDLRSDQRVTLLNQPLNLEMLNNIQQKGGVMKPSGLWYSLGNEWIEFAKSEMRDKFDGHEYLYELEVRTTTIDSPNSSAVLLIDTREDALELLKRSGIEQPSRFSSMEIKWAHIARHYGGIEVRDEALPVFYGWDINSGCVWNKGAITNVETLNQPTDYGQMESIPEQAMEDFEELLYNFDMEWKLECFKEKNGACLDLQDWMEDDMETIWNWMSLTLNESPDIDHDDLQQLTHFNFKRANYRVGQERDLIVLLYLLTSSGPSTMGLNIAVEIGGTEDPYDVADKLSKIFNDVYKKYGINKQIDIGSIDAFDYELRAQADVGNRYR